MLGFCGIGGGGPFDFWECTNARRRGRSDERDGALRHETGSGGERIGGGGLRPAASLGLIGPPRSISFRKKSSAVKENGVWGDESEMRPESAAATRPDTIRTFNAVIPVPMTLVPERKGGGVVMDRVGGRMPSDRLCVRLSNQTPVRRWGAIGWTLVTVLSLVLFEGFVSAGTFPLPLPTRPESLPLVRPTRQGAVVAWGWDRNGQAAVPDNLGMAVGVAAGIYHSLAIKSDGTLVAWGWNDLDRRTIPPEATNIVAVAAGDYHTLALTSEGQVLAWGFNINGQVDVPVGLEHVVAISAGSYHSVALGIDGTVVAWGLDGDGRANVPEGLTNVVQVSAGDTHTLALKHDGTVVAWGSNEYGESQPPAGLANVVAVAAGIYHSVALKNDGRVVAWGRNDSGQSDVPHDLSNVVAITAGLQHTVALRDDGTVVAWGSNTNGQTQVPAGLDSAFSIASKYSHTVALGSGSPPSPTSWRDDFDDDAINQRLWNVRLPFGASAVSESNGSANLHSRGMLESVFGVSREFTMEGRVQMNHPSDYFRIAIRSSLAEADPVWHDPDGVLVAIEGGGHVFIGEIGIGGLVVTNIPIQTGRFIRFRVTDDGSTIRLFLDDATVPLLTASTSYRKGDRIAFYNREFGAVTAQLDFVEISASHCSSHRATAVPELVNGFVVGATIIDGGCGYMDPPLVVIQGGDGTGATAVATVENGRVNAIRITNAGCCYSTPPVFRIASPPREPSVEIEVVRVRILQRVTLGKRYVLETSSPLGAWVPVGTSFTATDEEKISEVDVTSASQFFRIREVP